MNYNGGSSKSSLKLSNVEEAAEEYDSDDGSSRVTFTIDDESDQEVKGPSHASSSESIGCLPDRDSQPPAMAHFQGPPVAPPPTCTRPIGLKSR